MRRPSLPPAMEAQRSQSASREGSGRQDPPPSPSEASGHASQTPPPARPPHGRPPHHRQPKRGGFEGQLLRVPQPPSSSSSSSSSSAALGLGAGWQLMEAPGPSGGSFPPPSSSPSSSSTTRGPHPIQELQEGAAPPTRRERKPQKPGKYVCTYCGRPCAKPSVLQKHIRSHTGERPYPCSPCGFSFKTKSNLYKHRKSHAHRIKAGLASGLGGGEGGGTGAGTGLGEEPEEPTEGESTDSEDETGQHQHQHASSHPTSSSSSTAQEKQKSAELPLGLAEELPRPTEDSHAVKQRLAMRLSERKRFPAISPDETPSPSSSLGPGSKGSTESGYFSRSGSAELSQVSPPNANAKSYAEIILGKYGRLGGQPRHPHQQHLHVSSSPSSSSSGLGSEEKSIPFSVPKTQVIEHITKLITINEAVVDTSEIDSVKPRRSSLSRRSSIESPKFSTLKEPYVFDPKGEPSGSGAPLSLGSFSTGESFRSRFTKGDPSAPLLRSQSMPSSAGQVDTAGTSTPNRNFRLTQSFDEQQAAAAEMRVGHHQRMLKRQPAIEVPLGAEFIPEEAGPSSSSCSSSSPFAPAVATPSSDLVRGKAVTQQQHRRGPRLYECEACGARCKKRESYETHRRCFCTANPPQEQQPPPTTATATVTAGAAERPGEAGGTHREDRPQMMHYKFRAVAVAVRKRRKEESLEEDPPSPGPLAVTFPPTPTVPMPEAQPQPDSQRDRKSTWKEISVIQHTSSFEKQESVAMESQEREERPSAALQSSHQDEPQPEKPPQTPTKQHPFSRLVRQHNIQVPEILVTEEPDADMVLASPLATASSSSTKEPEKVEEFQWPQRSQTLAQLPAEKLPPKKKRLRLAEAAQSSGESSFESTSLPRSPSQESSISHASSRSASFEEPGKADTEMQLAAGATGAAHMLTVPSGPHQHHPHREMRRSASEQAPASAQHPAQIAEARSKSFDYGCLSPQRSAAAWKERRKCLLVKHATLGEPEQDEPAPFNPGPTPISSDPSSSSSRLSPEPSGKSLQLFQSPGTPGPSGSPLLSGYPPPSVTREGYPQIGQLFPAAPVAVTVADVLAASQIIPRAFLHTATAPPPIHPAQLRLAERLGLPLQPFPPLLPLGYPTGAAQALYLPVPSGLALQVPQDPPPQDSKSLPSASHSPPIPLHPHPHPIIAPCLEQLAPVVSLVVPVRLQTHVPTYASAMYTTLSQILVTSSHHVPEPVCCSASWVIMGKRVGGVEGGEKAQPQSPYLTVPTPDFKTRMPAGCLALGAELGAGLGEGGAGYGSPGVGGSKRMLSPAGSLELSTEAQRQQKRVKEEEEDKEEEEEEEDNGSDRGGEVSSVGGRTKGKGEGTVVEETITMVQEAETKVQELKEEVPKEEDRKEAGPEKPELLKHEEEEEGEEGRRTRAQSPQGRKSPSPAYPTLHTTTSVSWCYLNYTKPNPSPQQDPHASVYSSWCVSVHNPNLPGLSTRAALSLLRSKQKHSRETYTMANAPHPTSGKLAPGTTRKPRMSEVRSTSPSTPIKVKETPPSEKEKEEEKKGKKDEAAPSTSKRSEQPSRIRIFEGGYKSNEEYVYVRGRGRGKYVCEECGIRCKKPSMLKKHIRTHTDVRPYVCKHCNFAFKTKGNLTKHMKSKAHGKKCQEISEQGGPSLDELEAEDGGGGEERVGGPEDQEEHQFSDVDDSEDDDDNEEEEEEESSSHDEPPSSCSPDTRLSSGGRSDSGLPSQRNTPEPHLPAAQERDPGPSQQDYPSPRKLWPSGRASSPGSKRALFSPRGPWETSPRAFSPSGEGSPLRHLSPGRGISPGREVSPLRCLSPRLEVSPNRHLSPSPERGPSPIRPLSPGRYPSPRALPSPIHPGAHSRVRGSPIRTPGDTPSTDPPEGRQERGMFPEACLFPPALRLSPLPAGESGGGHTSPRRLDHVFSHLPLHSRQGPRAACLMIPIGGIQMVQPWPCPPHPKPSATRPHDRREAFPPATSGRGILQDYRVQEEEAAAGTSSQSGLGAGRRRRATPPDKQDSQTGGEDPTDTGIKQYGSSRTRAHSQGSTLVAATKVGATTSQTSESSSADPSPSQPAPPTHRTRQLSDREGAQGGRGRRRGLEQTGGGAGGRVTASKNKDSKTGST